MSFIYNAGRGANGSGDVNLTTRIEVLDTDGRTVIDSSPRPLATKGISDLTRISLRASLKQIKTSDVYLLRLTVAYLNSGASAIEQTVFTVE